MEFIRIEKEEIHCRDKTDSRLVKMIKMLKSYLPHDCIEKIVKFELNQGYRSSDPLFDKVGLVVLNYFSRIFKLNLGCFY